MATHIVIGPPGCGKTQYLTRQAARASKEYGGDSIIIASLTKAAAAEIASRAEGVPQRNIGTLHSHAYKGLRLSSGQMAQDSRGLAEWNKKCPPSWRLTNSVARAEDAPPGASEHQGGGDNLFSEIELLRARMVPGELWPMRVRAFWAAWCAWKIDTRRLDYTDMIEQALESTSTPAHTLFIDEAQDMSRLEMALVQKWAENTDQLIIAGDPDQAIYEFRGADPTVLYDVDADTTRTLAQSYRVPRAVHEAAVKWIGQDAKRRQVEYHPRDEQGLVQRHTMGIMTQPGRVVRLLEELLEDGSTVMVLTSCGYMLQPLIASLRQSAIPFHNPYRTKQGAWNPLGSPERSRLLAFMRMREDAWGDKARIWTWAELKRWTDPISAKGVIVHGMKDWIASKATGGRWDEEDEKLAEISGVLRCFETEHHAPVFKGDEQWWLEHLRTRDRHRQEYGVQIAQRRGASTLTKTPRLIVGSIHSAKGGEADKVVLAPDLSRRGMEGWMRRRREPVIRQFYVGMTRARHELHLLTASGAGRVIL